MKYRVSFKMIAGYPPVVTRTVDAFSEKLAPVVVAIRYERELGRVHDLARAEIVIVEAVLE